MERIKVGFTKEVFGIVLNFFEFLMITVLIGAIFSPSKALYFGSSEYSAIRNAAIPFRLSGYLIPITSTSVGFLSSFLFYNYLVELANNYKRRLIKVKMLILLIFIITAQARMAILGLVIAIFIYYFFINKKLLDEKHPPEFEGRYSIKDSQFSKVRITYNKEFLPTKIEWYYKGEEGLKWYTWRTYSYPFKNKAEFNKKLDEEIKTIKEIQKENESD